ncbi:MAG: universal stress protein [Desulfobacterales bacterium]|uniref:Universal stress protein n=1 Tax=Candidatus Desulfatibia vada TaxID=2841696 RepID=A0A8J6TRE0_9BACT|nr:universal stress protein [Candidatus Desulfatibia vada]MBL6970907.1 universal stress protein [Desulfobacterales bacterium]
MYKNILVPVDGSKRAEAILPHVENLARCFHTKVIFLIVEEPALMLEYDEVIDMSKYQKERSQKKKHIKAYLASLKADFYTKGIEAETLIGRGPVVKAIIDAAQRENSELVAMASHGHSGLPRTFYGSIAAGVLQRIDRPLLLIRSRTV